MSSQNNISLNSFKSRITLMILLLILVFNYNSSEAQISFRGLVIDGETNSVISQAIIRLTDLNNNTIKKETGTKGEFEFNDLELGEYEVNINNMGYEKYKMAINFLSDSLIYETIFLTPAVIETDRINVTSTKTSITLQQTPSSISVVTADQINRKSVQTFDNVLEQVQGVTVNRSSGINVGSLSIRGSSDVAGGGIGNRVLLLLDGRPSLTGDSKGALWSLIPVSIIERTEVVKGAFSSLYGSSAVGGVINVITKKPTYKSFTSINLNYGFYEKLDDNLKYTNNLLSYTGGDFIYSNTVNKFSYLLNFNFKNNDGHAQQTEYNFISGIGKFTYDLFTNRDLEATIQYSKSKSGFPHYWKKEAGSTADPYKVADHYLGDNINKEVQSFDLNYRAFPNSKSKYTTRFYYFYLNSNSFYNPNNPVSLQFGDPLTGLNTYIDSYNIGNLTQVDFELSRNNYLISGIDIQINKVKSSPEDILYGNQQMNNIGIFFQDQIKLFNDNNGQPHVETTIGGRFDFNTIVSGIKSNQFSPKISVTYSPNSEKGIFENSTFRILGGSAFRTPSIAELYFKKELFGGFDFIYNPDLQPEKILSAEIGFRKQAGSNFTLDFSAFYNKYEDLIQYVNVGTSVYGPFQVKNIADSQIKGFEFSVDYNSDFSLFNNPLQYFLNVSYTHLDARDLSPNRTNDYLPYKPADNFLFTADLNYSGFNFNLSGRYLSAVDEVLFYTYEEPESYFLLNCKLMKEITSKASIFIAVNNLFNESYQELERIQAPNRNFNTGINLQF